MCILYFQALVHPYFFIPPLPCQLSGMPKPVDGHRLQFRAKEYDTEKPMDELFSDLKGLLQSWYSYVNNSMEKKYCRFLHFVLEMSACRELLTALAEYVSWYLLRIWDLLYLN